MRRSRMAAPVIVMAAGIVLTAGCSSGGGLAPHSSGHPGIPATPHPSSGTAAIPTGTQLGTLLAQAHPPAGWKLPPGAGGISNSGSTNIAANNGPPPAEYTCKFVDSGVSAGITVSWWSSSNATMILTYPRVTPLPQVELSVAAYAPGAAAKNMAKAAALMARCRSFRDPGLHNDPTTDSVRTIPHLGNQNLFLTSKERTSAGTLTGQMLLVQDGNYIVGVDTNTGLDGNVRPATVQGFGGWLVQLLQSKSLS